MSLAAGREFLAIPGPTNIPDAVLAAMHRPAIDIYSGPLVALTDGLLADLTQDLPHRRAAPTSTPPTATAAGRRRSPTCSRAATRCWCWRAAASPSAGARWRRCSGVEVEMLPGDLRRAVRPGSGRGAAAGGRQGRDQGHPGGADRHRLGRRQRHPGDRRGDARRRARRAAAWSTLSPRSAACRSRWMPGASTSPWPARRRA